MFTRSAIFFPLVMAALLALVTYWISQTVEQLGAKIDGSNRHDPDYTMNNFVTSQTDATGKLRYVLAATEMVHYPDDDSTTLQRPRFTQYNTDKPYTRIEGLRGYISNNGEEIQLVDNVKVTREAFDGKGEMQISTEKLTILPDQDIAKTDSPVIITQAPKTVIHATGMVYNKKDQTVKLNKRVKVHYERPSYIKHTAKPSKKPLAIKKPIVAQPKIKKAKIIDAKIKPVDHKKPQVITKKLRSKK
ncbi:MAG: LPS export ABC transporter periplasmic protein LptC [Methylophilaceae bacterium]